MNGLSIILFFLFTSLFESPLHSQNQNPFILVLGIAQDGGYPHMACQKACCQIAWKTDSKKRFVVSLALVDPIEKKWWLFEASPDIRDQLYLFQKLTKNNFKFLPEGIFITHAHIGHYSGLSQFGREVLNTQQLPVFVLPRMKDFLEANGPWSQLVNLKNISLIQIIPDTTISINSYIQITPFTVPHRDEFSETAGFSIYTPTKKYLFIPDIDKWSKWKKDIKEVIGEVDIAFIDATFLDGDELPMRKIEEVPHPFVSETMSLFEKESYVTKSKIRFIHFNHTNPLLWSTKKQKEILKKGYQCAMQGMKY